MSCDVNDHSALHAQMHANVISISVAYFSNQADARPAPACIANAIRDNNLDRAFTRQKRANVQP